MTTESFKNGGATLSRMNFSGSVAHVQWRRNESESGWWWVGNFCRVLVHFLALQVQLVVLVSGLSWWSVQFGQSLVCCSVTHGAPVPSHLPFVKVEGARAPVPYGVGATGYVTIFS